MLEQTGLRLRVGERRRARRVRPDAQRVRVHVVEGRGSRSGTAPSTTRATPTASTSSARRCKRSSTRRGSRRSAELETRIVIAEGFQAIGRQVVSRRCSGHVRLRPPPSASYGAAQRLSRQWRRRRRPLGGRLPHRCCRTRRRADALPRTHPAPPRRSPPYGGHRHRTARTMSPGKITGAPHADRWAGDHIDISRHRPAQAEADSQGGRAPCATSSTTSDRNPIHAATICAPRARSTGNMFPRRFTLNAALLALHEWVATGVAAPSAPRASSGSARHPTSPAKKLEPRLRRQRNRRPPIAHHPCPGRELQRRGLHRRGDDDILHIQSGSPSCIRPTRATSSSCSPLPTRPSPNGSSYATTPRRSCAKPPRPPLAAATPSPPGPGARRAGNT